jgi:hypothetical protein
MPAVYDHTGSFLRGHEESALESLPRAVVPLIVPPRGIPTARLGAVIGGQFAMAACGTNATLAGVLGVSRCEGGPRVRWGRRRVLGGAG